MALYEPFILTQALRMVNLVVRQSGAILAVFRTILVTLYYEAKR